MINNVASLQASSLLVTQ